MWSHPGLSAVVVLVGFDGVFESVEAGRPQLGEEVLQRGHPVGVDQVQAALTLAAHANQAGLARHFEVQGDGLLGDGEVFGDLGDRAGFVADQAQDRPSVRLVVKLSQDRVDELLAAGAGDRFDPGHGRLMREWISLAEATDPTTCRMLMAEALAFVAAVVASGRRG